MDLKINSKLGIAIIVFLFIIAFSIICLATEKSEDDLAAFFRDFISFVNPFDDNTPIVSIEAIIQFTSEEDFKAYLAEAETDDYFGYGALGGARSMAIETDVAWESTGDIVMSAPKGIGGEPERVSGTNVQVLGIDEPDIVKTDGKNIYFSPGYSWGYRDYWRMSIPESKIKIVNAFPPADLASVAEIDTAGDLFLAGDILVVFSGSNIYGYDISNPEDPEKKWTVKLENNNSLVEARLYNNKIYLVTKQYIDTYHPCPIKPLTVGDVPVSISCGEIYHPVNSVPVDVTFVAMTLNSNSGKVEQKTSFVGSSGSSVVYMSEQGIYVTYSYSNSIISFFAGFLKEAASDLFPQHLVDRINKLDSYDISEAAKMMEFGIIIEKYQNSLDDDERMRIENEMENRMVDYYKKHRRELERTGSVKIGLKDLTIQASGSVPGYPLNQFALDEYNNDLRIATTIGENWNVFNSGGESANDVYVLDSDLKLQGFVQDLGLGERIYSVRFLGEMGYVVTYRQIDPFYVLDLSDPKNPEVKGELKIPGYSSYLHPLAKDRILGIGKEDWKVKLSLFDVSTPSDPKEIAKYNLDESYSDVLSTHHAFLQDSKHNIFFMPGSKGGYIFSYENDKLSLTKAISQRGVRRAIYINDYLYIISDNKISVLNEKDWERINELDI
ncbi:MAG: beta-propeller domain-containing protein [Spirochaetes bacterium]|nr:beta-propeller domain-containing protein [Spirochaetota bacterium]